MSVSPGQGGNMRGSARAIRAFTASVVVAAGLIVSAPAATADSRCNTNSHTHGVSFWQRTDHYVGKSTFYNLLTKRVQTMYQHTNSDAKAC